MLPITIEHLICLSQAVRIWILDYPGQTFTKCTLSYIYLLIYNPGKVKSDRKNSASEVKLPYISGSYSPIALKKKD
jgi:hypothetical protein